MFLFFLALQPLIDTLQEECALGLDVFRADDWTLIDRLHKLHKAAKLLQTDGAIIGYNIELVKSKLWWKVFNAIAIAQLPFAFLNHAEDANRPAAGVILLGSLIVDDGFVQLTLQKRQNLIEGKLADVDRM